jgi:tRNA threonylcarbamoyladenosine biosynthesis protein TsaB
VTILAFDTAQGALSAALLGGRGEKLAHHFELRTRGHAEALLPLLDHVLREAGLRPDDLKALAVTVGPGTFTGLRAGLAAARGFALARALPLVGVTTLEAVAEPVQLDEDETLAVSFDAKRGEIYLQLFNAALLPLSNPQLVELADAAGLMPRTRLVLAGTGAQLLQQSLARPDCRISSAAAQPDALSIARIAQARLKAQGLDAFRVAPSPLYLRAPDAKLPGGIDPLANP